jgi:hypothetical protein
LIDYSIKNTQPMTSLMNLYLRLCYSYANEPPVNYYSIVILLSAVGA